MSLTAKRQNLSHVRNVLVSTRQALDIYIFDLVTCLWHVGPWVCQQNWCPRFASLKHLRDQNPSVSEWQLVSSFPLYTPSIFHYTIIFVAENPKKSWRLHKNSPPALSQNSQTSFSSSEGSIADRRSGLDGMKLWEFLDVPQNVVCLQLW